jgi:allantoicase
MVSQWDDCLTGADGKKGSMDEQRLPDLLRLRGSVAAASDEFYAAKENLIKPDPPVFVPETYDAKGQVYDGWETRRRRGPGGTLPDDAARDWVIVRLGVPGVVRAIVVDTAFFTGNYPQACSAEACSVAGYPTVEELTAEAGHPDGWPCDGAGNPDCGPGPAEYPGIGAPGCHC